MLERLNQRQTSFCHLFSRYINALYWRFNISDLRRKIKFTQKNCIQSNYAVWF